MAADGGGGGGLVGMGIVVADDGYEDVSYG